MTEPIPLKKHYPALDGLRGIAILLVVLFHNFRAFNYFFFGWLGVDLFFVLSGFLITDILLNTVGSPHFLRNFFMRRMLRIFPLYYLVLIIFFIAFPLLGLYKQELQFYQDHQSWFWFYLQNWLLSTDSSPRGGALDHFWSLAIEEQFYIIWPLIILLVRKLKILAGIMLSLLLALMIARGAIWFNKVEGFNYMNFFTFTRIDGMCVGCIFGLV
jgi:peptidoglycan/LPS O-acetylase OafA/YrhL